LKPEPPSIEGGNTVRRLLTRSAPLLALVTLGALAGCHGGDGQPKVKGDQNIEFHEQPSPAKPGGGGGPAAPAKPGRSSGNTI
jgi:hypothetical protein